MTDYYSGRPAEGLNNCQPELLKNEESVNPDSARRNLQEGVSAKFLESAGSWCQFANPWTGRTILERLVSSSCPSSEKGLSDRCMGVGFLTNLTCRLGVASSVSLQLICKHDRVACARQPAYPVLVDSSCCDRRQPPL